jgi:hypothetical protein
MHRIALALVLIPSLALAAPSFAAPKPKPIKQTVPFRDATPDPSGIAVGSDGHCSGLLPREAPIVFKAPAAGKLDVSIRGFTGEWALQLRNDKDAVLAAEDVPPPDFEKLSIKIRKAATINVLPCNLAGSPDGIVDIVFTYS